MNNKENFKQLVERAMSVSGRAHMRPAIKLNNMIERLDEIIRNDHFTDEISRFIPSDIFHNTLKKEKFLDFLTNENKSLLLRVKKIIG